MRRATRSRNSPLPDPETARNVSLLGNVPAIEIPGTTSKRSSAPLKMLMRVTMTTPMTGARPRRVPVLVPVAYPLKQPSDQQKARFVPVVPLFRESYMRACVCARARAHTYGDMIITGTTGTSLSLYYKISI